MIKNLKEIAETNISPEKVEKIARVCYEVNRAYCQALGDNSSKPWDEAPEWQKESNIQGVMLHLKNPAITPEKSHEAWFTNKAVNGWTYGVKKDPVAKTHPAMVPYNELPLEQRAKDYLFKNVVVQVKQLVL